VAAGEPPPASIEILGESVPEIDRATDSSGIAVVDRSLIEWVVELGQELVLESVLGFARWAPDPTMRKALASAGN